MFHGHLDQVFRNLCVPAKLVRNCFRNLFVGFSEISRPPDLRFHFVPPGVTPACEIPAGSLSPLEKGTAAKRQGVAHTLCRNHLSISVLMSVAICRSHTATCLRA